MHTLQSIHERILYAYIDIYINICIDIYNQYIKIYTSYEECVILRIVWWFDEIRVDRHTMFHVICGFVVSSFNVQFLVVRR